jgi:hypothetical protein
MIKDHQILRKEQGIILGIALENAVLDILTSDAQLHKCLKVLREPHAGLVSVSIGTFGIYPVTLSLHHDDGVSLFIDGPDFYKSRSQSAGIWLGKEDLQRLLIEAVQGESAVVRMSPHHSPHLREEKGEEKGVGDSQP